jgi:peptide/nickel transport system ATP-binding protein
LTHSSVSSDPRRSAAATTGRPLLEIDNLSTHYISAQGTRVVRAVDDVSLRINAGETIGIVGESGSGKSTLALSILRVLPTAAQIVSGQMWFEGQDLVRKTDAEMRHVRGKRIAMILQDPMASLNPLFTIGNQVAEPIRVHEGAPRSVAWRRARELLKAVRIPSPETRLTQYPHEMSGGMRQRAMIALALACRPKILLADEPTTALDATVQIQILLLLRELQREFGMSVIFVTHDIGVAIEICDRVAVMYAGQIVEQGTLRDIVRSPVHPYARGLLASTIHGAKRGARLETIPGTPPSLSEQPHNCSFAPRCSAAQPRCLEQLPPNVEVGPGRVARCVLAEAVAAS